MCFVFLKSKLGIPMDVLVQWPEFRPKLLDGFVDSWQVPLLKYRSCSQVPADTRMKPDRAISFHLRSVEHRYVPVAAPYSSASCRYENDAFSWTVHLADKRPPGVCVTPSTYNGTSPLMFFALGNPRIAERE
jgi:hypothetical protein